MYSFFLKLLQVIIIFWTFVLNFISLKFKLSFLFSKMSLTISSLNTNYYIHNRIIKCRYFRKVIFFLLVFFEGEISKYLQGNWTACVALVSFTIKVSYKAKRFEFTVKILPPYLRAPRGGGQKNFLAPHLDLLLYTPLRLYSVYF